MLNNANQRPGNLQRAEWRKNCRQILSDHLSEADHIRAKGSTAHSTKPLECNLGIIVHPAQVRLIPDIGDGYEWATLPEKEHLFKTQLSKHSTGAYMELCREVGESFEAVARPDPATGTKEEVRKVKSDPPCWHTY